MSEPASNLERLVYTALIVWPARTQAGLVMSDELASMAPAFRRRLRALFPRESLGISDTDLDAATARALQASASYRQWWSGVLRAADLQFDFGDREPRVAVDRAEAWEGLLDHLDSDALVTCGLADQRVGADGAADVRSLVDWSATVRIGDRGLEALWRRGLSDLHVHFGGTRFAQIVWFDLMDGVEDSARYKALLELGDLSHDDIQAAAEARAALWAFVDGRRVSEDAPLEDRPGHMWRWDRRRLIGERILLRSLWGPGPPEGELARLRTLDAYLSVKLRFMHAARQPALEGHIGLRHFDDSYFRSLQRAAGLGKRYASSPRLEHRPFADALRYLLESRNLKRIELRTAPFEATAQYGLFARRMAQVTTDLLAADGRSPREVDIRVALHFKRSRKLSQKGVLSPIKALLTDTDRASVILSMALAGDDAREEIRACFSRIDVAGQERDTPAWVFAPYLRLVRGDEATLQDLGRMSDTDPRADEFQHWRNLAARGRHWPTLATPRLGMTVHAGEDCADPLDGLHQIACAKDFFRLGPGDGIGHGLAMASDVVAFSRERRAWALIARGAALDSMIWLYDLIASEDHDRALGGHLYELQTMIEADAAELYGGRRTFSVQDLIWLRHARVCLATPDRRDVGSVRWLLFKLDATAAVRERRDQLVRPSPHREKFDAAVVWAQRQVIEDLKRRRIVVEINPSSNLRISGAQRLGQSPAVKVALEVEQGLLASINTDNPGIFLSRVENEYALLLAGLRDAKVEEGRARDLLEKIRRIGLTETWWPESVAQRDSLAAGRTLDATSALRP